MANYHRNGKNYHQGAILGVSLIVVVHTITTIQTISSVLMIANNGTKDIENNNSTSTSNYTTNQSTANNLILPDATTNRASIKKEPKVKTWTHSDSYEWSSTSDGTREETIDSNGRKHIKTKLINSIQAPDTIDSTVPLAQQQQQQTTDQSNQNNGKKTIINQQLSPQAPINGANNTNNNNGTPLQVKNNLNYQQLNNPTTIELDNNNQQQLPNDGVPLAYKQTPVFISQTLRHLGPGQNHGSAPTKTDDDTNIQNKNHITTYNFPDSDMRVHIGDEATDSDQPTALKAQLDDAIFDTMSSHLNNGGIHKQPQHIGQLSKEKDRAVGGQSLLLDNSDQLKFNLNNIIRQMTQGEQTRQRPDFQIVNNPIRQDLGHPGQNGQASSLHYNAPLQQQQQLRPMNSPWTIQRRVYVITYPQTLANSTLEQKSELNGSSTNQTAMPQTQQQLMNGRKPQTIVQVFEQTQHILGNPNTPITGDQNNRMYQYPSLASSATTVGQQPVTDGRAGSQHYLPKIDNLFNLWN